MLDNKRLIFTLTPGRSGSMYLSEMLKLVPGVHACHEWDDDKRITDFVRVSNKARIAPEEGKKWWLDVLLSHIDKVDCDTFAMTSNLFGRGMAECLIELIDEGEAPVPDIIVLRRPTRDVALSFWSRQSIPARTQNGQLYHFHPEAPSILHLEKWQSLDDYQLVYWDTLEMELRMTALAEQFKRRGGRVFETTTVELTGGDAFLKLVDALELPEIDRDEWEKRRWAHHNESTPQQSQRRPEGDLDELEAAVREQVIDTRFQQVAKRDSRPKCDIVVLTQPGVGNINFDLSVRILQYVSFNNKVRASVQSGWHNPTSSNRNLICRNFRYAEWQADWLLMIDADQSPRENPLDWCFKGYDVVLFPTPIWKPTKHDEHPIVWNLQLGDEKEWIQGQLPDPKEVEALDVRGGGTGMILVHRRVLEHPDMQWPFKDVFDDDGVRISGHDLEFCYRAKAAGFSVVGALPVYCGHYKKVDLIDVLGLLRVRDAKLEQANEQIDDLQESLMNANMRLELALKANGGDDKK